MATISRLLSASSKPGLHHFSSSFSFGKGRVADNDSKRKWSNMMLFGTVKASSSPSSSAADTKTKSSVELKTAEPWIDVQDLVKLLLTARPAAAAVVEQKERKKEGKLEMQMVIERSIFDCRFFALLAVAGSLIGSVLCFIEGCFLVVESYFHYFHTLSTSLDQGHLMKLLIESIDMFLVGTAMLVFGVGLHAMFVGSKNSEGDKKQIWLPASHLFGLFHLKYLPGWVETESVSEAKSKIGHAVMMILQVGLLEKFKNIPLVTSFDLACFAAAVLVSSASTYLLSKLYVHHDQHGRGRNI
ncbi:hypothetical protein LINPERPRIM_LOCUS15144 [Linum perenne]